MSLSVYEQQFQIQWRGSIFDCQNLVKIKTSKIAQAGNKTRKMVFQEFNARTIYTGVDRVKRNNKDGKAPKKNN